MTSRFANRLLALARKETRQMLRDVSSLAVGLVLPAVLILLFGYGLSFDVKSAPIAVVLNDRSPAAHDILSGLEGSPYVLPVRAASISEAEDLMRRGVVIGIVQVPEDFSRRQAENNAHIQLVVNGITTTTAATVERYVRGAINTWEQHQSDRGGNKQLSIGRVELVERLWFNEAGISTWYLVPGLVVVVMTLIGTFLTSLLIAREWERGTLEALFVTPVQPLEIILSKLTPYIVVGAIDLGFCLLAARFLFEVPIRGSLPVIVAVSLLYLVVSLLLGLLVSGITRNQFQASQLALLVSFMPAVMLSGFVFDLRNVPTAIRIVGYLLPGTHFMSLIKTLFLAGDHWPTIIRDSAILTLYALGLGWATHRTVRKSLD